MLNKSSMFALLLSAHGAAHVNSVSKQWLFLPLLLKTHENIAMGNKSRWVSTDQGTELSRLWLQKYRKLQLQNMFWILEPYFKVLDSTNYLQKKEEKKLQTH